MNSNSRILKGLEFNSNNRINPNNGLGIGGISRRGIDATDGLIHSLLNRQLATVRGNSLINFIDGLNIPLTNARGSSLNNSGNGSATAGIKSLSTGSGSSSINNQLNKNTAMFDSNKDGVLSLDEVFNYFITMKARKQQPSPLIFQASPQAKDIARAIEAFDKHGNQNISDPELVDALLKLRGGEYNQVIEPSIAKFVLGKFNKNIIGLEKAIGLIDSSPDKVISNLEVLNILMASRKGTVDINEPNIKTVLKTNPNFDRLLAALNRLNTSDNGELSDQEAFQIILDLRKVSVSDETLDRALFLGLNTNTEAINHSVQLLDSEADGQITNSEFVTMIMKIRKGEFSAEENQIAINVLDKIPQYKNIKDIITALDSSADGQVSDDELIDFTLGNIRGHINIDQALVDLISNSPDRVSIVKSLISKVDADHSGTISNQEYLTALTDLENRSLSESSHEIFNKILSRNPNHQAIETALSFIDRDFNSTISDTEVSQAILAQYKGETKAIDPEIFNMILITNDHKTTIESIINSLNPKKDGHINSDTILSSVVNFKKGSFTADETLYRAVLDSISNGKTIIDTYELIDSNHDNNLTVREYTQALMNAKRGLASNPGDEILTAFSLIIPNADIVKQAIEIIDSNKNGIVSAQEFVGNFTKAISNSDGSVDLNKMSILADLLDIIYPDAAQLAQFQRDIDTNIDGSTGTVSDLELINGLLNLNSNTITNPGADIVNVVLSANPNKVKIIDLVNSIDQDKDGAISNTELTSNLMKVRKGDFPAADIGIVQAILNKNTSFNSVQSIIDIFDPDQNGLISDIEMFVGLMAQRNNNSGITFTPEIVNTLKTLNPNTAAIEALINSIDPNNSGTVDYDELVSAYLKINAGTMANVSADIKRVLPAANGLAYGDNAISAETLVDTIDADHNGQVSDLEIANIIIANKKNNILSSYAPDLVAAIFRTNPNRGSIEALINQIGGSDGEFTNAEVASVILSERIDHNIFGNNSNLVAAILSAQNSSYTHIKNLISSIDGDNNGAISDMEAMKSIVGDAKGLIAAADKPLVDSIISSNANLTAIKNAYNSFGIRVNSSTLTQDLFGTWIEIQQGLRNGTYFNEAVEALGKTAELNSLKIQFTTLDADHDGEINESEFGGLLVDVIRGSKEASDYNTLINYLGNDPKLAAVKTIIASFDKDANGIYSDQNILEGLLVLWNPSQKNLLNENFIQSLLSLNTNSSAIQKILNLVDPAKTGAITNNSTVGYIHALQLARYSSPQYDVAKYDFNGNGTIDQGDFNTYNAFYQYITKSSGGTAFRVY